MTNIPTGYEFTRTTPTFDNHTVPAGLLNAHRVADGVWGRLVVHTGVVAFISADEPAQPIRGSDGGHVDIPPARPQHLELDEPATFAVEFYRSPTESQSGLESTGLATDAEPQTD